MTQHKPGPRIAAANDDPVIILRIDGGVVLDVISSDGKPPKVLVLDYDIENDDREFTSFPDEDGTLEPANAFYADVTVDARRAGVLRAIADADIDPPAAAPTANAGSSKNRRRP